MGKKHTPAGKVSVNVLILLSTSISIALFKKIKTLRESEQSERKHKMSKKAVEKSFWESTPIFTNEYGREISRVEVYDSIVFWCHHHKQCPEHILFTFYMSVSHFTYHLCYTVWSSTKETMRFVELLMYLRIRVNLCDWKHSNITFYESPPDMATLFSRHWLAWSTTTSSIIIPTPKRSAGT